MTDEVLPTRRASRLCCDKGAKPTSGDLIRRCAPPSPEGKAFGTLPSTDGMGTTILYIGGSILVLAAAILHASRQR